MPLSKRVANFGQHTNRTAFAGQSEFQVQSFAHRKRLGKHATDAAQSDISRAAAERSGSPRARNRERNVDRGPVITAGEPENQLIICYFRALLCQLEEGKLKVRFPGLESTRREWTRLCRAYAPPPSN